MRRLSVFLGLLALAATSIAGPALAQGQRELKGSVVQVDLASKHVVVEQGHGRKYKQPLQFGAASKVVLPSGPGTLEQVHVGDEVVVRYHAGATGEEIIELRVTRPAGT